MAALFDSRASSAVYQISVHIPTAILVLWEDHLKFGQLGTHLKRKSSELAVVEITSPKFQVIV